MERHGRAPSHRSAWSLGETEGLTPVYQKHEQNSRCKGSWVLFVCQVFAAGTVFSEQAPVSSGAPISLHPLKTDEPAPTGVRSRQPSSPEAIFLVTNHTAKTIVAHLSGIEVKSGSNW